VAVWVVSVAAGWAVLMGLILPPVLRHQAESRLSEKLGSACTLAKVRFNPFTLRLAADNLRIPLPDGADFFSLERFEVRVSPSSLVRFAPVVSDVQLFNPRLELALRQDGTLSSNDLGRNGKRTDSVEQESPLASETAATRPGLDLFGMVINDLAIRGGYVHFRDHIKQAEHTVADLALFVPFTSTLNRHRDRSINPFLEGVVNGRPLRVEGRLTPFAEQLRTEFNIRFDSLELVHLQPYLVPFSTAVLKNGQLTTDLVFSMVQLPAGGIRLGLDGTANLAELAIVGPDGQEALRLPQLMVEVAGSLNTPEGMTLKKVAARGLEAHLVLLEDGRLDWLTWMNIPPDREEDKPPLPLHVARFELREGRLLWQDRKVPGGFAARADNLAITVSGLHLPGADPAVVKAVMNLNEAGQLTLEGKVAPDPLQGHVVMRLENLPVAGLQPYLAATGIPVTLEKGDFSGAVRLEMAGREEGAALLLKEGTLGLRNLALQRKDTGKTFFRLGELALSDLTVDIPNRQIEARQLLLDGGEVQARRDRNGVIDLMKLRPSVPKPGGRPSSPAAGNAKPWQTRLAELKLQNGRLAVGLEAPRETSTAVLQRLSASVSGFDSAQKVPLAVVMSGRGEKGGSLNVDGQVALNPLALTLRVRSDGLNLKPLSPLLGQVSPNLRLGAGTLSMALQTSMRSGAGPADVRIRGQASLDHLSLLDGKQEFAAMRTLRVQNLDLQTRRQRYVAGQVTLVRPDFNLIMAGDGITNVARLLAARPVAGGGGTTAKAAQKADPGATPFLRLGEVAVREGRLRMRDLRYQPALSNRLEKLAVTIQGLESNPESRARIAFSGELDGAPIRGEGSINPLQANAHADLQTELRALNLTPLSPLSERFIAYPMEKGIFTLSSKIVVEQGRLDSTHRIRLDSLALGDKVQSPDAPNLPVKLGVSLLQDPAGNINITLPVHGDLNDPSFSIGGLIFKVIVNLLMKAVTSPFALLGSMLGLGGEGFEYVPFAPGDGRLLAENAAGLPALVDMLNKRPNIKLRLIPQADEEDRDQLAEAFVLRRMQELKHAGLPKKERPSVKPEELKIGPQVDADEYQELLFKVYAEQPFDKPRNLLRMVRELPPQEMMEKIREHHPRDDEALKRLALERAQNLREAFIALDPTLAHRISIGPPEVPGPGHRVSFGIQ
jgi:uncharacterized protein involved in outer membrane biogenesis